MFGKLILLPLKLTYFYILALRWDFFPFLNFTETPKHLTHTVNFIFRPSLVIPLIRLIS